MGVIFRGIYCYGMNVTKLLLGRGRTQFISGLYRRLLWGLLRGILGIWTVAHVGVQGLGFGVQGLPCSFFGFVVVFLVRNYHMVAKGNYIGGSG